MTLSIYPSEPWNISYYGREESQMKCPGAFLSKQDINLKPISSPWWVSVPLSKTWKNHRKPSKYHASSGTSKIQWFVLSFQKDLPSCPPNFTNIVEPWIFIVPSPFWELICVITTSDVAASYCLCGPFRMMSLIYRKIICYSVVSPDVPGPL